jgi:hypothetical protein
MSNVKFTKKEIFVFLSVVIVFCLFAAILAVPVTREWFKGASNDLPYLMGFVKFALLATAGELIAIRMASGKWNLPVYLIARIVIWGVIGIWITYMMKMFYIGAGALMAAGLLPTVEHEFFYTLLRAFFTSATMNLSFGPTFMAIHKCSDAYLALRAEKKGKVTLRHVIENVDWTRFVSFTLFKTVPLFWIPMHTLTFLLPAEYQVFVAALLSVALGVILNLKKAPKVTAEAK